MDRNLGYNIRKMRELRGYTQEHVAHGLGIDPTSYGHIESGKTKLSLERLDKIAEILKTTRQAIEEYNEESLFYIINHQGNAGQITINNASFEEIAKVLTEPYKQQIIIKDQLLAEKDKLLASKDEEIQRLRSQIKQQG